MGYNSTSVQIEVFPQEGRKWRTARRWQQTKYKITECSKDCKGYKNMYAIVRVLNGQGSQGLWRDTCQRCIKWPWAYILARSRDIPVRWWPAVEWQQGMPHTHTTCKDNESISASPSPFLSEQFRLHHDQVGDGTWWKCMVLSVTWSSVFEHFIM